MMYTIIDVIWAPRCLVLFAVGLGLVFFLRWRVKADGQGRHARAVLLHSLWLLPAAALLGYLLWYPSARNFDNPTGAEFKERLSLILGVVSILAWIPVLHVRTIVGRGSRD